MHLCTEPTKKALIGRGKSSLCCHGNHWLVYAQAFKDNENHGLYLEMEFIKVTFNKRLVTALFHSPLKITFLSTNAILHLYTDNNYDAKKTDQILHCSTFTGISLK